MSDLPAGTVTLLFTDVEGSTKLLQQLGSEYAVVLADQRQLIRSALEKWSGREVDTQGDALLAAFSRAANAVNAAVEAQLRIAAHSWPGGVNVRVRMGLHTGEPLLAAPGYVGLDVHRAARICAAGHGGQVLLSSTTHALVESNLPDGVTSRDLGEHRLKDLARPSHIYQLAIAGLPIDFPPLKSLDVPLGNLPVQLTSFIGRESEMAEVKRLLNRTRLLTLAGVGGAGKTRLALQVAAEVLDIYPDGVWLVQLSPLSDPALVPQTAATALGLREEGGRSILDTLDDYLRAKDLLLVMDNCEHLIEACAKFADRVLRACPKVRLLTTSRQGLGIEGETTWRVPSLSLPGIEPASVQELAQFEAVRLFVERARCVFPEFELTGSNAAPVAQVCRRLDGIPLAIELAAARVKMLSVEQIAGRLDDRFRLLTDASRAALPRQRTLRALIDWSYDLLSKVEQTMFRGLAVFVGGFSLDAVESVCGDGQGKERGEGTDTGTAHVWPARGDVLDLLAQLVDKSLVLVERTTAENRYRMLETVRQYSRERLLESGEDERLRERHVHYYLAFAEQNEFELRGPEQSVWMDRMELEHDNFRSALEWTVGRDGSELGLRLVAALSQFWQRRHLHSEAREWSERALARASALRPSRARARTLNLLATMTLVQGNYQTARSRAEESMQLARELKDWRALGEAQNNLGMIAWHQNEYVHAREHFEQSLAIFRQVGDGFGCADSLHFLGHAASDQGDYGSAKSLFEESLGILKGLGDKLLQATLIGDLGLLAYLKSDSHVAGSLLEESLALAREIDDEDGIAQSLQRLGDLARCKGDYEHAESLYNQSLELVEGMGAKALIPSLSHNLGYVALHKGDISGAAALFTESLRLFREQSDKKGIAECLEGLAGVAGAKRQWADAASLFGAAEKLRQTVGAILWPADQYEHDRSMLDVRSKLAGQAFTRAWAEGNELALEQAIELAMNVEE